MRFHYGLVSLTTAIVFIVSGAVSNAQDGESKKDDKFESLFDGESLEGWSGDEKFWSIEDGAITGQTTKDNPTDGNTFLIWQGGDIGDFELRLKYRIENGNSGIQFRSKDLGEYRVGGYQADIDSGNTYTGILYEERGRGILAQRTQSVVLAAEGKAVNPEPTCDEEKLLESVKVGDWNEYIIVAKGNKLTQSINGFTTVIVTDNNDEKAAMSGILALQLHAGPPMKIQFKDIKLRQD